MKKKLFIVATLVFIAFAFTSCEKTCKTCKQVTYINGSYDHEGSSQEYCGLDLAGIEATPDVTIGSTRTAWECN
jgi:ABC-type proline/glycine betaine transport system substrate-binding protein